jgi:hypothetical protein
MVTELSCPACSTTVRGAFTPEPFADLPRADLDFVLLFLRRKGNLKDMERDLGISYWTIRRRLDQIVERVAPGAEAPSEDLAGHQTAILRRLQAGEIDADQAVALLRAGPEDGNLREESEHG